MLKNAVSEVRIKWQWLFPRRENRHLKNILGLVSITLFFLFSECGFSSESLFDQKNLLDIQIKKVKVGKYDFQKNKKSLLYFFASWCGYCKKEFPGIQKLSETHKSEFNTVLISLDENEEDALKVVRSWNISLDVYLDDEQKLKKKYNISKIPAIVILDKDGRFSDVFTGTKEVRAFIQNIEK